MDLAPDKMSIDIEDNKFIPNYDIMKDKQQVVSNLKSIIKKYKIEDKDVILAADQDREGEMIAYSIAHILKLKNPTRILFNEITKKALNDAISSPTVINMNMVQAQQTRRLIDRLTGYSISPILNRDPNIKNNGDYLSAGRVQSVVVRLLVDKETEVKEKMRNQSSEFSIDADFKEFKKLTLYENSKNKFNNETKVKEILPILANAENHQPYKIKQIKNKIRLENPPVPFTTSTLQQDASNKLKFNIQMTMSVAQKLYEKGKITYMRTDSTMLSKDFMELAKTHIIDSYGNKYHRYKEYKSKSKNAQEAHEAIRPTSLEDAPIDLTKDEFKLYTLIFKRAIGSQMAPAKYDDQTIKVKNDYLDKKYSFDCVSRKLIFDGYLRLYNSGSTNTVDNSIGTAFEENQIVKLLNVKAQESLTKLTTRYNEATLVKKLEADGIGRPSTFVSIITKIQDRKYVERKNIEGIEKTLKCIQIKAKTDELKEKSKKTIIGAEKNKLIPTEKGIMVNDYLMKNFQSIMDYKFTSQMEDKLDEISLGKLNWQKTIKVMYDEFNPMVEKLKEQFVTNVSKDRVLLGDDIYKNIGKFGPMIEIKKNNKVKFVSLDSSPYDYETITLKEAR